MNLIDTNFQTPVEVCKYMVSLIPDGVKKVLVTSTSEVYGANAGNW